MRAKKSFAAWRGEPECQKCSVRQQALFCDLVDSDFFGLDLHIEDLEFPTGSIIYSTDQPGRALFTVRHGTVKLVQYLPNGSQRIVRLLRRGATLGLEAVSYTHLDVYKRQALINLPIVEKAVPRKDGLVTA